jgi:hypothetical protein
MFSEECLTTFSKCAAQVQEFGILGSNLGSNLPTETQECMHSEAKTRSLKTVLSSLEKS